MPNDAMHSAVCEPATEAEVERARMTQAMTSPMAGAQSPAELAELISTFNDVTARLHQTHETLAGEVARLKAELRDANEQLRRSRQLAALGEMAAGIAHEIRNPLSPIGLYAGMLEEDLADRPEQADLAARIGSAVRGLDRIVGDVLTFARDIKLRSESTDPAALAERVAELSRPDFERRGVELDVDVSAAAAIEVPCDAGLVQQALLNVLRNACDSASERAASDPKAEARARLRVDRGSARDSSGRVADMARFTVHDSGDGVSEDVIERMFNPFFTTRAAGTGLGLAIVHRIIDAHGGRVRVWNHHEGGAVFELLLPIESTETDGVREGQADGSQGGVG